jgi:hypothetical protein
MWDFVMEKSGAGFLRELWFHPANLHSICFSTIIFTITRGWHNRPGVAALPIASQTKKKKIIKSWLVGWLVYFSCSHLEHRASVKRFVSLQFYNLRLSLGHFGRVISPSQGRYPT